MKDKGLKIFVVEDDEWYQKLLIHTLSLNPDNEVKPFSSGSECIKHLKDQPDLITIDYRLPDMKGDELLEKILDFNPEIAVIAVSEQEDIETAVNLLRKGAYDYITKTKDIRDRLLHLLGKFSANARLKSKVNVLQDEVERKYDFQKSIIGQSDKVKKIFKLIEKATSTNITVMITGETGTGKEVVAKAIHYNSEVRKGPFVAVNMTAIPAELAESELFGHEKGAFTGAGQKRIGKFEQADGGTLFLDEIGEMDMSLQSKLLRALQEKEITRVGGEKTITFDCRVITATHRDLQKAIKDGKFREDLYYRLFGLPIELPPLKERGKDIILLAKHFAEVFCRENDIPGMGFSKEAMQKLMAYEYPGNIRELKSIVELAAVMADGEHIEESDITFTRGDALAEISGEEMTLKQYERKIVNLYLNKYDNDIKTVAKKLDIGQSTIYRMLKED